MEAIRRWVNPEPSRGPGVRPHAGRSGQRLSECGLSPMLRRAPPSGWSTSRGRCKGLLPENQIELLKTESRR